MVGVLGRGAGKDALEDPAVPACVPVRVRGRFFGCSLVLIVYVREHRHLYTVPLEGSMKRVSVMLTALVIIVLAALMCWKPAVATPNTGLTQEARTELANALRH